MVNSFQSIDPFFNRSPEFIYNKFCKLIQNKDKQFLLYVQQLIEKRLIELN